MERVEFEDWPQINFNGLRILIANTSDLTSQGFAGAKEEEFENTIIIFPKVEPWKFNMNGVVRKIKIAYLDENYKKLEEFEMAAEEGTSLPPEGTKIAIEGLPEVLEKLD